MTIALFVYGSLRQAEVQLALFGRQVAMAADSLPGFALATIHIEDPDVIEKSGVATHSICAATGDPADRVEGFVLRLTPEELKAADAYETADYVRIAVRLASGADVQVYARKENP
jgi:gamma-glutamylcyclotransferase (GGCT)/AIG2-like uncharacterized protein YtfP